MGCSSSKPERAEGSAPVSSIPGSRHEDEDEAVPATETGGSKKPPNRVFHSYTTEASSNLGFRGSGTSFQSLPSTTESIPRSEGGSEMGSGSMSLFSASSKRSTGGFGIGEKLSELSDEEGFEEDFEEDFEDADQGPRRARGGRAGDRPAPLRAAGSAAAPGSRCVPWWPPRCLSAERVLFSSRPLLNSHVAGLTALPFCAYHLFGTAIRWNGAGT